MSVVTSGFRVWASTVAVISTLLHALAGEAQTVPTPLGRTSALKPTVAAPARKPAAATARTLPPLAQGQALIAGVAVARARPAGMSQREQALAATVAKSLRVGKRKAAEQQWQVLVNSMLGRGAAPADVYALIQTVLRESYLETARDLRDFADKVRYYNELKGAVREHIAKLRQRRSEMGRKGGAIEIVDQVPALRPSSISRPPRLAVKTLTLGTDAVDAELEKWEEKLAQIGDDAQLANIDLQNALQKQQQTLQQLSNIAKLLHDTAMAIIRKIG